MTEAFELADRALLARGDALIALRRQVHRCPELSFREHRTATLVAERLRASGLEVRERIAGTGVVGVLSGSRRGRTVAWRADMDALPIEEDPSSEIASSIPGVMHACGHDGHTAMAVTIAEAAAAARDRLAGTLVFVFQPAEEVFGGATLMIEESALDQPKVEEIFGLHLTTHLRPGELSVASGVMWASADLFEIELVGQGAHGAYPSLGRSPILAAATLVQSLHGLVPAELPPSEVAVLTVGKLSAGDAANVIPAKAVLAGSLRALAESTRRAIKRRIEEVAASCAALHRVTAVVRFSSPCAAVRNHGASAELVRRCASEVLGSESVLAGTPSLASDDMSAFLTARSGCYFRAGIGPQHGPVPPHHSREFWMDEGGLLPAARVALRVLIEAASLQSEASHV